MTPHLAGFGFKPMQRDIFTAAFNKYTNEPARIGRWTVDSGLDLADWPKRTT